MVCLELFDKLLDNALELEILFSKIKDKESERHVYSVPLEYYISKETEILKSISASDLENLVSYMKSRYGFTFDGLFFPKFFLYKDNHLCVLRVYRQIFQLNQFYQLQKLSNVSCFEAEKLSISSYMVGVKNQANAISLFESILLNNYLTLDSKYESKLSYLYLTLDNKSCVKKDVFSSSFIEDVLKFVGCDIYELSNSIFEHCFNSEFLSIFQSYFFSLEEEYRQDIFQFIKAAYLKCKEHNESLSCDWVTDFLKDYFVGQLNFSLIEPLAIKPSAKIKNFSFSELSYFDSIFFSLMDMTKEIWHFCKVVMESKANNELTESRTIYYEKIKSLLANREMFMDKIVNFEDFQEYVLLVYGVEEIDPLFLVSLTSSVIYNSSLEDIEVEYSLIEEFVVRFILESSKSIELDSKIEQDGISTSLYEPDIDEVSMRVSKLEKVLKAFISYFRSHSTEEDFYEKMNELQFDVEDLFEEESLSEEMDSIIYNNFQFCLYQYLLTHQNDSSCYKEILYAYIITHLLDGELDLLIQNDFQNNQIPLSTRELSEKELMDLEEEYYSLIEMMCENYPLKSDFSDTIFHIYLEALSYIFSEESLNAFENLYFGDQNILKKGGK